MDQTCNIFLDTENEGFCTTRDGQEKQCTRESSRKGPWTAEEDSKLISTLAAHGEGRWNSLANLAGLQRTGKSCRLRWLNYLRPDLRHGSFTLEEQLHIFQLHVRWGNRWSKIAEHLPGRTDNEIKNFWRTKVQKIARKFHFNVNTNSVEFKDALNHIWIPRLVEQIHVKAISESTQAQISRAQVSEGTVHHKNGLWTMGTSGLNESQNDSMFETTSAQLPIYHHEAGPSTDQPASLNSVRAQTSDVHSSSTSMECQPDWEQFIDTFMWDLDYGS